MPTTSQFARTAAVFAVIVCLALIVLSSRTTSLTHCDRPPQASLPDAFRRVTPTIACGATPQSPEEFRALWNQGVRTIVSVDGALPDVETASTVHLKYIHVPIGYDGIPEEAVGQLTRVFRECETLVYVHCHHGKHRGPAAAAVCGLINREIDTAQARKLLSDAGTSHDYAGLWQDVEEFKPFPDDATLPQIVSQVDVEPLIEMMVRIDSCWDELQVALQANDISEAREQASILEQLFRESYRMHHEDQGRQWLPAMREAESAATALCDDLDRTSMSVSDSLKVVTRACRDCHQKHRN